MNRTRDHLGRPIVAVTGMGLVTPLGFGVAESWAGQVALPEEAGRAPFSS
ncbi:MAG: beta-ketoacyl-ACP synthase, partial [Acetobacteraceae bacterium]